MATQVETFDSKDERNQRFYELRKDHPDTVRFSSNRWTGELDKQGRKIWISTWSVAWATK